MASFVDRGFLLHGLDLSIAAAVAHAGSDAVALKAVDIMKTIREFVASTPSASVVPVVFCDECHAHGLCLAEKIFLSEEIERPYCCRGHRGGDAGA